MSTSRARFGQCAALLVWLSTLGCSSPAASTRDPNPYLNDRAYRRAELEAALVNPSDGYGQVRLARYATGTTSDWDNVPEWNPETESIAAAELDAPGGATSAFAASPAALSLPDPTDEAALLAFGKLAFSRYPAQLAPFLQQGLASRAAATRYGLWLDDTRGVGGVVRVRMADGSAALALTCSTCHAAPSAAGSLEDGASNAALDLGAAVVAASGAAHDPEIAAHFAAWGPGRLDVTTRVGLEPARIADLRAAHFQTNLQQDATLRMRNETTLAIRIETLLITSSGQVGRPPRVLALALAAYLDSFAQSLPSLAAAQAASPSGASVFAANCASCHAPPTLSGPAVALSVIGTDPTLGLSTDRGTGMYRVPSLRGVGTRGPLLHDGTVPSLAALFDPARQSDAFNARLHGTGPVAGHRYGLDLPDADRSALIEYLSAL
jgi:cytochrome c5